jgi:hypothetical protein
MVQRVCLCTLKRWRHLISWRQIGGEGGELRLFTHLVCLPRCAPRVILHNLYPPWPPRSLHRCKMMAYIPRWRGEAAVVAGGKVCTAGLKERVGLVDLL